MKGQTLCEWEQEDMVSTCACISKCEIMGTKYKDETALEFLKNHLHDVSRKSK